MPAEKNDEKRGGIRGLPMIVAVGAVIVWLIFVVVLLTATDSGEQQWTRLTFIFASVQAIAFAGAGALFGVSVQEKRVESAEKTAQENVKDAESGRALAAINLADEADAVKTDVESAFESYGPSDTGESEVRRRHAAAARRLFPKL